MFEMHEQLFVCGFISNACGVFNLLPNAVVLNRGYTYHFGVRGAKAGVRSTKVFRDTRSGNLNQILLNIHRDSL